MEIKVGMYVKYTRGIINGYVPPRIAKITDCSDKDLIKIDNGQVILRNDILKAKKNIIDLIQVGDYVNGCKVIQQYAPEGSYCLWIKLDDGTYIDKYEDIKSIITKEQIESIKYEVK